VDFFDAFRVSRWDVLEKLAYAGPLAALAFFFQVRHVFARLAHPVRAAQTTVVAWLVALAAVPDAGYSPSRNLWQDDAIGWPSFQFGWPGLLASAMGDLARGNLGGVRTGWYLAPSVFGVLVLLFLLVHLVRAGRRRE
jgi:hypothetical protein